MKFRKIAFCAFLMSIPSATAAITATIAGTSTSTQLDLVISGTVGPADLGTDGNYDKLLIWAPGVDWAASASLANFATNEVDEPSNTAPTISGGVEYVLSGAPTVLGSGTHDSITIRAFSPNIEVGDFIDWSLSVRNFGSSNYDFTTLINAGPSLSAQVGSGESSAVPEPSSFLFLGATLAGFAIRRRR